MRRGLMVIILASALLAAPARAATPDLTGSWINVAAPSGAAWSLDASASLSTLTASWHGTAAQGHPTLVGSFKGTLNTAGTQYAGPYNIHESGTDSPGNMTVAIDSASKVTITLYPNAGGSSTYTFQRAFATAVAPAASWCSSLPSRDAVAAGVGQGCQTDAASVAPGGDVIAGSPDFSSNQQSASADVSSSDWAGSSVQLPITTLPYNPPRHAAECVTVARQVVGLAQNLRVDIGGADWQQIDSETGGPNAVLFAYALLGCLEVLHAQQAAVPAGASAAAASCPVSAIQIKSIQASHKSISFRSVKGNVKPPVAVSCTRHNGIVAIHVKSRSHQPLRALLGPRLLLSVYHARKAKRIMTVRAAFTKH